MDWVDKSMRLLIISFVYLTRDISTFVCFSLGKVKEIVIFSAVLCYNMAVHEREQFADKGLKGSVRIRRSADSVFVFTQIPDLS